MNVTLVAVGRPRGPVAEVVAEYEERAARYWKLERVEVDAGAPGRSPTPEAVRAAEEERILGRLPAGGRIVALTREGKGMSSTSLARLLGRLAVQSTPSVTFVVGGAFGLGSGVLERAHRRLSLSPMTLPHELARLVLAEQLYRAGTILRNEPYHKGGG